MHRSTTELISMRAVRPHGLDDTDTNTNLFIHCLIVIN